MKTFLKTLSFLVILLFGTTSFSFEQSEESKKYDSSQHKNANRSVKKFKRNDTRGVKKKYGSEFKSNFKKYKKYSPEKKKRYKNKWSSFKKGSGWKEMSPAQKKRLREKVLEKKRNQN